MFQASQPSLPALRSLLSSLLPALSSSPVPAPALAQLPLLCTGLQQLGSALEQQHGGELEAVCGVLVSLCKDTQVRVPVSASLTSARST